LSIIIQQLLNAPILTFDTITSTNEYAAQLIAQQQDVNGHTIVAKQQTQGKGQRGNTWYDVPNTSLLMSIILQPQIPIEDMFCFSAAIAVAVAETIQALDTTQEVHIKFPNDIILNRKKVAGILVENTFRGSFWSHAIIGIGINVHQTVFERLPYATSLKAETHQTFDLPLLLHAIREKIFNYTHLPELKMMLDRYNHLLYHRGIKQKFRDGDQLITATIVKVNQQGQLVLQDDQGVLNAFAHGVLTWVWDTH
jgi:BirA family biotin operon repressor/biotin-[acetyl-CoA-carboxylase] ligase